MSPSDAIRARWQRFFDEGTVSGDPREISVAVDAATGASQQGASEAEAKAAGRAAARRYREGSPKPQASARASRPPPPPPPHATTIPDPRAGGAADWSPELALKLFTTPARWGWQVPARLEPAPPVSTDIELPPRPMWTEPIPPDAAELRLAKRRAVSALVWRIGGTVVVVVAFLTFQGTIRRAVLSFDGRMGTIYTVLVVVLAGIMLVGLIGAFRDVQRAQAEIDAFERPFRQTLAAERTRHERAVAEWEAAAHAQREATTQARRPTRADPTTPLWYPVRPRLQPSRVDIIGGDRTRNGWASLMATIGSAMLASGQRVTVLDLTGQQVGDGLTAIARAHGLSTWAAASGSPEGLAILASIARPDLPIVLAEALTHRGEGEDRREERAFASDVLRRVVATLPEPLTGVRLSAAVRVLNRASGDGRLSRAEVGDLLDRHLGDLHQGEWTSRQLSFLAGQLDLLAEGTNEQGRRLFADATLTVVATEGGHTDRKEVVDRVVVHSALRALDAQHVAGVLVVAGADQLGASTLRALSDHAVRAGVLLMLLIDQLSGPLEGMAGTGGVACIMKMYNHRDAQAAAEFVGRGHSFVLSGISRQVGRSFGETGGDSTSINTGRSNTSKTRSDGSTKRTKSVSDSRGHAWSATRSWSATDNLSTTESTSRVYEFLVEPSAILDMPETAFLLVDNTGADRRIVLADGNPGISLLDRVSPVPL